MPRRDITLGDRDEARKPRLGREKIVATRVKGSFGHPVADREQLASGIEQKAVAHLQRHRPRCRFEGRQARRQERGCLRRLIDVLVGDSRSSGAPPSSRTACPRRCRRLVRWRMRMQCRHDLGLCGEFGQMRCDALKVRLRLTRAGRKCGDCVVELMPRHGQRAPPVTQLVCRFPGEIERVGDPGQALRGRGRHDGPLPASIGQCDQVASQVPAIDRGDIGRIERAQIARVVPIVEMPAKPREAWPWWPASSPGVRSLRRFPAMRNRGRPPPTEDTARDWSGEVRWASAGTGSSWKLSGGSMWSAAVTKVSKYRQVRRAIIRNA